MLLYMDDIVAKRDAYKRKTKEMGGDVSEEEGEDDEGDDEGDEEEDEEEDGEDVD